MLDQRISRLFITAVFMVATTTAFVPPASAQLVSGEPGFGRQYVRNHPFSLAAYTNREVTEVVGPQANFNDLGTNTINVVRFNVQEGVEYAAQNDLNAIITQVPDEFVSAEAEYYADNFGDTVQGFLLGDEPDRTQFADFRDQHDVLRPSAPHKPFFSNAFPDYATERQLAGEPTPNSNYTYGQYLDEFVSTIDPDIVSYDYYPFVTGSRRRKTYFSNLLRVRDVAQEAGKPYRAFLQGFASGSIRVPSESDLRMQAFTHLAAGYKALDYFTYNPSNFDEGLVEFNNNDEPVPTQIYRSAQSVNPEILNLGRSLRFLKSRAYRFVPGQSITGNTGTHKAPQGIADFVPGAGGDPHIESIQVLDAGDAKDGSIGLLTDDRGQHYFLLTNIYHGGDLTPDEAELTFLIDFDEETDSLLRLNRETGEQEVVDLTANTLELTLPGGTGDLFKYNTGDFVVPEPTSLALLGAASLILIGRPRRS